MAEEEESFNEESYEESYEESSEESCEESSEEEEESKNMKPGTSKPKPDAMKPIVNEMEDSSVLLAHFEKFLKTQNANAGILNQTVPTVSPAVNLAEVEERTKSFLAQRKKCKVKSKICSKKKIGGKKSSQPQLSSQREKKSVLPKSQKVKNSKSKPKSKTFKRKLICLHEGENTMPWTPDRLKLLASEKRIIFSVKFSKGDSYEELRRRIIKAFPNILSEKSKIEFLASLGGNLLEPFPLEDGVEVDGTVLCENSSKVVYVRPLLTPPSAMTTSVTTRSASTLVEDPENPGTHYFVVLPTDTKIATDSFTPLSELTRDLTPLARNDADSVIESVEIENSEVVEESAYEYVKDQDPINQYLVTFSGGEEKATGSSIPIWKAIMPDLAVVDTTNGEIEGSFANNSNDDPKSSESLRLASHDPELAAQSANNVTGNKRKENAYQHENLKASKKRRGKVISRAVFFCRTFSQDKPYTAEEEVERGRYGYVKWPVEFLNSETEEEVSNKIVSLFSKLFIFSEKFEILYVDEKNNCLKQFFLPTGTKTDGKFLEKYAKDKFYVREVYESVPRPNLAMEDFSDYSESSDHQTIDRIIAPNSILAEILNNIESGFNGTSIRIEIRRDHVLEDLQPYLDQIAKNSFTVKFIGEAGVGSGTKSDMFRCVLQKISNSNLFEGTDTSKTLKNSVIDLNSGVYELYGEIFALSIAHGGPPPAFLSRTLFRSLLDLPNENIPLSDVHSPIKSLLEEVSKTTDFNTVNDLLSNDVFLYAGTYQRVTGPNYLEKRDEAVQHAIRYITIDHIKACVESFKKGLNKHFELLNALKCTVQEAEALFCFTDCFPTADAFWSAFQVSERDQKSRAFEFLKRYIQEIIVDPRRCHYVRRLFSSITGSEVIPPFGFRIKPRIVVKMCNEVFTHLCSNELTLPQMDLTYEDFVAFMEADLKDKKEETLNAM